jgi:hypothetical protein
MPQIIPDKNCLILLEFLEGEKSKFHYRNEKRRGKDSPKGWTEDARFDLEFMKK